MAGDRYSFTLEQLLDAIHDLESLAYLALSKDITSDRTRRLTPDLKWPKNLVHVRAPGRVCTWPQSWDALFRSWPTTLQSVIVADNDTVQDNPFAGASECLELAHSVQNLDIKASTRNSSWFMTGGLHDVLHLFPRLTKFTIPAHLVQNTFFGGGDPEVEARARQHASLEILIIDGTRSDPWPPTGPTERLFNVNLVNPAILFHFPSLRRLELHGPFKCGSLLPTETDEDRKTLEDLSSALEGRATPDQQKSSGIFLVESA